MKEKKESKFKENPHRHEYKIIRTYDWSELAAAGTPGIECHYTAAVYECTRCGTGYIDYWHKHRGNW